MEVTTELINSATNTRTDIILDASSNKLILNALAVVSPTNVLEQAVLDM